MSLETIINFLILLIEMKFITLFNHPNLVIPARAYLHNSGFNELYKNDFREADSYFLKMYESRFKEFNGCDFLLAFIFSLDKKGRRIEFFKYFKANNWPCMISELVRATHNDSLVKNIAFIINREREHRNRTKSLQDYIEYVPALF